MYHNMEKELTDKESGGKWPSKWPSKFGRIVWKTTKYIKMVVTYILNPEENQDIKHRIVNFANDVHEWLTQKISTLDQTKYILEQFQDQSWNEILFDMIKPEELYASFVENIQENGSYWVNQIVSCWDEKRLHAHWFVVEKNWSKYTSYFMDPEYVIRKKDDFSPSITNAYKLEIDKHWFSIVLLRVKTWKEDLNWLNNMFSIHTLLKDLNHDTFLQDQQGDVLMYYTCDQDWNITQLGDGDNKIWIYNSAKLWSTSYILKTTSEFAKNWEFLPNDIHTSWKIKSLWNWIKCKIK